jgi:ABC-type multidrug transport system ATPase subunit
MIEPTIQSLIKLFALITNREEEKLTQSGNKLVEAYLSEIFSTDLIEKYLQLYNDSIDHYHNLLKESINKNISQADFYKNTASEICNQINSTTVIKDRFLILIQLLEFIKKEDVLTKIEIDFIDNVANYLNINNEEYPDIKAFVIDGPEKVKNKNNLLLIAGEKKSQELEYKYIYSENQAVEIWILWTKSVDSYILKYSGPRNLYLNGHKLPQNKTIYIPPGSQLKTSRIKPIYFNEIQSKFVIPEGQSRIIYCAKDIEYKFNKKNYGVHRFSFCEESGNLIGIMGGSGVGKSTLLNVLNGNLKLTNGFITINGYNLHTDKEILKGLIGYVPQEDLLVEELTVFQNLYFNAKLCFSSLPEEEIIKIIEKALIDFDLVEARDLVVGNPLKNVLSGGQRKRLNIALELIREPAILFVDEPTSGLSSMDSEKVMHLLKKQALKGKLVITVIHQPSSDIYKLIDRLIIMDKGGYVVFNGNPIDAITYFKKIGQYVNPEVSECLSCGTIKTEQPLRIIETRLVDPFGKTIRKRKISPKEWYNLYLKNFDEKSPTGLAKFSVKKQRLPKVIFKAPGRLGQFKIFSLRDIAAKLSNRQYMIIALFESPLLAIILSVFSRYCAGNDQDPSAYVFSENVSLPPYLFMSIVVALFFGLIQSAEEIFKDRRLLKRESFLHLSRLSYLASKTAILFSLSAFQMLVYAILGNLILGIHGLTLGYWLILFTTACFANALGLNLSAGLNSAVTIYIIIPLLIIPQLLLSGVVINFKKLPNFARSEIYTPIVSDFITSRWALEALAVYQYKNNKYTKLTFDIDLEKNETGFKANYYIPYLNNRIKENIRFIENNDTVNEIYINNIKLLKNEFNNIYTELKILYNDSISNYKLLYNNSINKSYYDSLKSDLNKASKYYDSSLAMVLKKQEILFDNLKSAFGGIENFIEFKNKHYNKYLAENLEESYELKKITEYNHNIYQYDRPILHRPKNKYGRAHFYAPSKYFFGAEISTFWFNIIFIWFFTIILLVTLYYNLLKKTIDYFEKLKLMRDEKD